ncbi:hypothetical protein D3C73_836510 [compost metagenome]
MLAGLGQVRQRARLADQGLGDLDPGIHVCGAVVGQIGVERRVRRRNGGRVGEVARIAGRYLQSHREGYGRPDRQIDCLPRDRAAAVGPAARAPAGSRAAGPARRADSARQRVIDQRALNAEGAVVAHDDAVGRARPGGVEVDVVGLGDGQIGAELQRRAVAFRAVVIAGDRRGRDEGGCARLGIELIESAIVVDAEHPVRRAGERSELGRHIGWTDVVHDAAVRVDRV